MGRPAQLVWRHPDGVTVLWFGSDGEVCRWSCSPECSLSPQAFDMLMDAAFEWGRDCVGPPPHPWQVFDESSGALRLGRFAQWRYGDDTV